MEAQLLAVKLKSHVNLQTHRADRGEGVDQPLIDLSAQLKTISVSNRSYPEFCLIVGTTS